LLCACYGKRENSDIHAFLDAEGYKYAVRLPANLVLQERIGWLLKRPVGRPPREVRRYHASFSYQAGSWSRARRVVAKVEWHPRALLQQVLGAIAALRPSPPSVRC
jgi:hypothetical protein